MFTPDPIAFGFPTEGEPVLIDLSASLTTNGMTGRLHKRGERLAHPWLLTAEGEATDDPAVLFSEPRGTIFPAGGVDAGHKGYALALIVETLTGGIGGLRSRRSKGRMGRNSVRAGLDPAAFGGPMRLPGKPSGSRRHAATIHRGRDSIRYVFQVNADWPDGAISLQHGVALHADVLPSLEPWSTKLSVPLPRAI